MDVQQRLQREVDRGSGPPSCLDAAAEAAMMTRCSPMRSFATDTRPVRPCRSASSSAASQSPAASWELDESAKVDGNHDGGLKIVCRLQGLLGIQVVLQHDLRRRYSRR